MAFNFNAPASSAGGTGFNFGSSTPAKPTFGAPAAAPSFGTPANAGVPSFGATPTLPTFGATQTAVGGFGASTFAAPIASAAPSFGTTSTPGFGGFGTLSKPTGTVQPLINLSTPVASMAPTLPTFGQATAAAQPTLSLGGLGGLGGAAPAAAPTAGAFNFSATTTSSGLSFAAPATNSVAPTLSFGATPASTAGGTSLGMFGKPTTTAAAPTASLFGAASTASAAAPAGGLFGANPVTTSTAGGLFGSNTSTLFGATPATSLLSTPAAAPTVPKLGLGGVDTNAAQPKTVEGRSESARAKEMQLPQEIVATVESLKTHIKQQKQYSSDIARTSTHKLFNVSSELQSLNWALAEVANCVQTNHAAIKMLRFETAGAIRQAEMAQRTHEIQPGLQFENTAPLLFFMELVLKFESDMITFRNQVELTERHMRSLAHPQSFTDSDLKKGLQQIHESFIALAGRLHETHQKVETAKEQYLNLRKHLLKDKTNVFEDEQSVHGQQTMANISCGPTPFSATFGINLGVSNNAGLATTTHQHNQTQASNVADTSGFGLLGRNQTSLLGPGPSNVSLGFGGPTTNLSTTGGAFNLQNPPIGSKRNKQ